MCLLNCNTKKKKYKHITYAERTIRNAIKNGIVFEKIKHGKIIYKTNTCRKKY